MGISLLLTVFILWIGYGVFVRYRIHQIQSNVRDRYAENNKTLQRQESLFMYVIVLIRLVVLLLVGVIIFLNYR